jgi:hypothetical protein
MIHFTDILRLESPLTPITKVLADMLRQVHRFTLLCRVMAAAAVSLPLARVAPLQADEYLNGIKWTAPSIVAPGAKDSDAPSDAIVLFNGKDVSQWKNADTWTIQDGVLVCGKAAISTKAEFGDCQLHIEWSAPTPAVGSGQGRGNSGVFLMGKYELQVLDSYDNTTYFDGQAGSIYKQTPPMANAMRKPGEWNSYDIFWTCPKFKEDGSLASPAYITAIHNGVLILNHFELLGDTPFNRPPQYKAHPPKGPISIQDHGNPVRFRNIWVRELKPVQGVREREPFLRNGAKETPIAKPTK